MKVKRVVFAVVVVFFMLGFFNFKDFMATKEDYIQTAEVMASFIKAEYQRQMELGQEVDLKKIVRMAKKLDDYNLSFSLSSNYLGERVVIYKFSEPEPIILLDFTLGDQI